MALCEIPTTFSILFTSYGEIARHRPVKILTVGACVFFLIECFDVSLAWCAIWKTTRAPSRRLQLERKGALLLAKCLMVAQYSVVSK